MLQNHFKQLFAKEQDPFPDIIGQTQAKHDIKSALASGRHIILVGQPGIGKTTLAKNIARLLPDITVADCEFHCNPEHPLCPECQKKKSQEKTIQTKTINGQDRFVRVQGSPDLTAEDLLGDIDPIKAMEFGPLSIEAFTPGKVFKANSGILFFDEVNRSPPKIQNALLQVLEEGYATIGSYRVDFQANFLFIGTMNPQDASTEELSSVFLDRFDLIYMHPPESIEEEAEILTRKGATDKRMTDFIVRFIQRIRKSDKILRAPSVRATIGLQERAQANATLRGKAQPTYSDVFSAVRSVLPHRLELKPSVKYLQTPSDFVTEQLRSFAKEQGVGDELEEGDVP
jgi:Mg-chelatase subunit ChlI